MEKQMVPLLFTFMLIMAECSGQSDKKFLGTWTGHIKAGVELKIVFHVTEGSPGHLMSTADSPDQAVFGIKCDTSFISGENLTIEMHALNASFTGRLVGDSAIDGMFKQGG